MKFCSKCKKEKPFSEFYSDKISKDGLRYCCKLCADKISTIYRKTKKGKLAKIRATIKWKSSNLAKYKDTNYKYRSSLRKEAILAYGNKCACCEETIFEFLTIDHVGGGGNHHRKQVGEFIYLDLKRKNFPKEGYRVLCMNCNWGTRYSLECPHKKEKTRLC